MIDSPTGSSSMPEAYKNYYDQIAIGDVKNKHSRSLRKLSFLGDLINGLNYELTDEEIIEAVKKAKNMLDRHSTAGEIIAMTNVVLEYEIDVKSNVIYVLDGLCGRAVFEYGKKRLSNLLLRKATRMVERLQHLNKINLIPTELLVAKKTEQQVEPIVLDFMTNDEKFGYLDLPDDSASDAWSNGRTKMMQFAEQLNKNKKICPLPNTGNENKDEPPAVYSFDGIEHINNHSRVAIDKLFSIVYKRLAADLAGTTSSPVKFEQGGPMTHSLFGGIVRKMTKIMFSVNGSYEENIYVLGVVIDKVVSEMRHRSPKVQYMRKTKKSKTVVSHALDMSYYPKLVNNLKVQKQIAEQRKYDTRCKEMCNMRRRAARVSLFKRMHMEAAEAEIEANINKARINTFVVQPGIAKEEQSRRLAELDQEQKLAETMADLKRREIVQKKTEQWAQENCHELRHMEKQLRTAYAKKEIMAQIKEKEAAKKEAKVRDYYDDLKMIEANEKEKLADEKSREKRLEQRARYKKAIVKQWGEAIDRKNPQPYCPMDCWPLEKNDSKDKLMKMNRLKQDMNECVRMKIETKQAEQKQADLVEKYVSDFLEHKKRETKELDDAKKRKQDEYDKVYEYLVNNLISLMSDKSEKLDMKLILEEEQQRVNDWLKVKEDEHIRNVRRYELIKQNDAQLMLKEGEKQEQKKKDLEEAEKFLQLYREDNKVEEVKHDDKQKANTEYGKELKRLVNEKEKAKKEAWEKMKNEAREAAELEAKRMAEIKNTQKIIMQQHEATLAGFFPPNLSTKRRY
ncbi:uncharacterized protein LOC126841046 [Adelges cooleyi]|uniref:uncharacterized protein LOC126841046 n=1 Tax=Adelges cooleyi TaxID=133065 RepID=UPI0021806355|nr:uncharacterized protein LOC126841046 [Adelges cooleyi]